MSITQLPPAPSRTDPATFSTRADTFVAALPTFVTEANATAANVTARENQIEASAAAAASSEAAAAASENQALEYRNEAVEASGAVLWVAGTSYAIGDGVVSPTNFKSYRDKVGGVSNTDPANDLARWLILEVSRLEAIATTKAVTAVDVFVYDTSKDSDGGAWRKRCQHTSWYNEPLNTTTRGARREFPAVAVIVAEANNVTIYDGDDPTLPMWMVFTVLTSYTQGIITGGNSPRTLQLSSLNGLMSVGVENGTNGNTGTNGLFRVNFIADTGRKTSGGVDILFRAGIDKRNLTGFVNYLSDPSISAQRIVNSSVKDVAMTVLPDAPIDPATGLSVPTIAVATSGGVSVIKDNGTVVSLVNYVTAPLWVAFVDVGGVTKIFTTSRYENFVNIFDIPSANFNTGNFWPNFSIAGLSYARRFSDGKDRLNIGAHNGVVQYLKDAKLTNLNNTSAGFGIPVTSYITTGYNTGWMPGNIKGAFLADTDDTDLVGGTDADRSVNANPLTVNGTITRTPVATGADLVGYSGFSETNYLEGTDATYADTLYALGWEQTAGVWEFKHGVVSAAPIDGLTITGTTLKIAGTKPKALVRVTATTPSTAQLAKIQADERFLFQADAACTLYGASDAVTALAHDPDTGLLHVGTSAGRSVFQGLRRVSNTTTAVGTAISASNGLVVEE